MDELEALRTQQMELAAKIKQLEEEAFKKKEEARKHEHELKQTAPVIIKVLSLSSTGYVHVKHEHRDAITTFTRGLGSEYYWDHKSWNAEANTYTEEYHIRVTSWGSYVFFISTLDYATLDMPNKLAEAIKSAQNAPAHLIDVGEKVFTIKLRFDAQGHAAYNIPGYKYIDSTRTVTIPRSEAKKLWDAFSELPDTEFTPAAKDVIIKEVEQQSRIDAIVLAGSAPEVSSALTFASDIKLRPFQEVGVKFATEVGSCIIGDEMGIGKTIQAIATAMYNNAKSVVIVCPAHLKPNWMRRVKEYTGEPAYPITGTIPTKGDMVDLASKRPRWMLINYDLIGKRTPVEVAKGATVDRFFWAEVLDALRPEYVIVDEGHYIKELDTGRSRGVRQMEREGRKIIFLTGTPIVNRPREFFPMLTMVRPDLFPSESQFEFQYTDGNGGVKNAGELRNLLRGIMIRRTKKDVLPDLPPINRIDELHELSDRAKKLYNRVLAGVYETIAAYNPHGIGGDQQKVPTILAQITRLKQVCAIDSAPFTAGLATDIVDSSNTKVLIFTHWKGVCYNIHQRLNEGNRSLCFVSRGVNSFKTANMDERYRIVDEFTNDPSKKYLVVTENTAAEGLDITSAGSVIFNDLFWTPKGHQQSEGRAYGRLNDPHPIDSYYVIAQAEIIQWIQELLARKIKTIEETVEGVEHERSEDQSIVKELINRIKYGKGGF